MVAKSSNTSSDYQHTIIALNTSHRPYAFQTKVPLVTMRVLLPAAILLLVNMVPILIAAPVAIPAPTAQPSSSLPNVEDRSLPLEAREPTKIDTKAAKAKPRLGKPTDYAHVDLEGMIGDLRLPQEIKTFSNSNSTTATSTKSSATATSTKMSLVA